MPNEPKPTDERRTNAWIGKALRIEGRVTSQENLTIDGEVEGTIELGEHTLTIGHGATVTADLAAKAITISGTVTGNIVVTDQLDLQPTGSVDGDIVAPRLSMADGAVVRGRVDVKGTKKAPPA
ncbi:MAG TPA: polymer-forming cytoskeletal protein [Vicinamibacterales bacterium]|jgi:cytoskeletal protein CcmA (bactofilin family)